MGNQLSKRKSSRRCSAYAKSNCLDGSHFLQQGRTVPFDWKGWNPKEQGISVLRQLLLLGTKFFNVGCVSLGSYNIPNEERRIALHCWFAFLFVDQATLAVFPSFWNESVAAHLDRYGSTIRELCNQRLSLRFLAPFASFSFPGATLATRPPVVSLSNRGIQALSGRSRSLNNTTTPALPTKRE